MQGVAIKSFKKSKTINNLKQKNKFLRQTAVEGYDPMQIPGNVDKAIKHMVASKIGREAQLHQLGIGETLQICPCCGKYVQKTPLSIKMDVIELSFLGSGYPMYFEFIRFCILLMAVLLFFNGLYGLITNGAYGTACLTLDEINKLPSDVKFRLSQRKIDIKCDENDVQANDYTALFSNIPKKINYQGDPENFDYPEILRQHFQKNLLPDREVEIVQVGLCFNCDKIVEKVEALNTLILQKQMQILQGKDVTEWNNKILSIQQKKRDMQLKYSENLSQSFIEENFTGYAYVIFQNERDKEECIRHYEKRSLIEQLLMQQRNKKLFYEKNRIRIVQAPDPNNINWKCLKFSYKDKLIRRVAFFFLTIICLGACLSIIMGLNFAQRSVNNSDSDNRAESSLISIAISICISILNPILRKIIILISKKEGRSTKTSVFIAIAIRSALAQFLNSSILLILTQILIVNEGSVYGKIFGRGGLALNINTVFLTQMILTNLLKIIHFEYIFKNITRNTLAKYIDKIKLIAQGQLNGLFEQPEFSIEEEYARNLEIVYSVLFYAPIFPICLVWGILTLFFKYWVDKYNLMHKSTVKFNPSLQLCLQMTESLEYCLPLYSLANMLAFIYINNGEVSSLSIFGFLIGLLHAFLPMQILNERVFITKERISNECTYQEVCDYFGMDYDMENPVINEIAIEQHIFRVKSQISNVQNSKKEFLKNANTYQTTNMEKSQKLESPELQGAPILKGNDFDSNTNVFNLNKDRTQTIDGDIVGFQRTSSQENPFLKKKVSQFNPNKEQTPKKVTIKEDSDILMNFQNTKTQQGFEYNSDNENKQRQNSSDQLHHNGFDESNKYHNHYNNHSNGSHKQQNGSKSQNFKIEENQELQESEGIEDIDIYFQNIINNSTPKTNYTKSTASSGKRASNSVFSKTKKNKEYLPQTTLGVPNNDDYGLDSVRKDNGVNSMNPNIEKYINEERNNDSSQRFKSLSKSQSQQAQQQQQQQLQQQHKKQSSSSKQKEEDYTDIIKNQEAHVVILQGDEDDSDINSNQ